MAGAADTANALLAHARERHPADAKERAKALFMALSKCLSGSDAEFVDSVAAALPKAVAAMSEGGALGLVH
jgi:hypothetical protein